MSMATLEKALVLELRTVTGNHKLKLRDVQEWSTAREGISPMPSPGESYAFLPKLSIHLYYLTTGGKKKL